MLITGAVASAGCSDNSCGPGDAPEKGIIANSDMVMMSFGLLTSGLNNDCPASDAPPDVTSMTILGHQTDSVLTSSVGLITLCVSRPDLLAKQAQPLGIAAGAAVRLVDLSGDANNCSFAIDGSQPATGTATSSGLCDNGNDSAGFALTLDGSLSLTRTCGTTVDSVQVTLRGRVAVKKAIILTPG